MCVCTLKNEGGRGRRSAMTTRPPLFHFSVFLFFSFLFFSFLVGLHPCSTWPFETPHKLPLFSQLSGRSAPAQSNPLAAWFGGWLYGGIDWPPTKSIDCVMLRFPKILFIRIRTNGQINTSQRRSKETYVTDEQPMGQKTDDPPAAPKFSAGGRKRGIKPAPHNTRGTKGEEEENDASRYLFGGWSSTKILSFEKRHAPPPPVPAFLTSSFRRQQHAHVDSPDLF